MSSSNFKNQVKRTPQFVKSSQNSQRVSPDALLSTQVNSTIKNKIIKQVLSNFDPSKMSASNELLQKINLSQSHLEVKSHQYNSLTPQQQAVQKQQALENYQKEFIEKKIIQSKKLQKLITEASQQAENIIRDEIFDNKFERQSKVKSTKHSNLKEQNNQVIFSFTSQEFGFQTFNETVTNRGYSRSKREREFLQTRENGLSIDKQSVDYSPHKTPLTKRRQSIVEYVPVIKPVEPFNIAKDNFNKINQIIDNLEQPEGAHEIQAEYDMLVQSQEDSKALIKNHGKKLRVLLEKWCESEEYKSAMEDPNLNRYRYETWGDLINFEKKLKEEMLKLAAFTERIKFSCFKNIDWIKQKTSGYIECLEIALNEVKLEYNKKLERLQMQLEDYESRQFSVLNGNDFLKSALEAEKEMMDNKEITSFRQAMQQINRFKQVIERLHKDYVKMVQQSKQMQTDIEQLNISNQNLQKKLSESTSMNDNLLDIVITLSRTAIFYKDDEVVKTCRKILIECEENLKKETLSQSVTKLLSFIRQYPPVDLVTPLRKDSETLKVLLYTFIDYLNGTNQLIKYWVPQFEDTDDQYKTVIDGWHKNYLVNVFEHETLQFLMRFRPNNQVLPFKFQTPPHVIERNVRIQMQKEMAAKMSQQEKDQSNANLQNNESTQNDKLGSSFQNESNRNLENNQDDSKKVKISTSLLVAEDKKQQDSMASQREKNKRNLLVKTDTNTLGRNLLKVDNQPQSARRKPTSMNLNSNQKKEAQASSSNNSTTKKTNKEAPKNSENNQAIKEQKKQNIDKLVKQVKLPANALEQLNQIIISKHDSKFIDKVLTYCKEKKQQGSPSEIKKSTEKVKDKDKDKTTSSQTQAQTSYPLSSVQEALSDQEIMILQQLLQPLSSANRLNSISSNMIDAQNLIKCINEFTFQYFQETQQAKFGIQEKIDPNSEAAIQWQILDLFEYKGKVLVLNLENTLTYLKNNPNNLMTIFKLIVKYNMFLSNDTALNNDLDSCLEQEKQKIYDQYDRPNLKELKVMDKLLKVRRLLRINMESSNQIGDEYFEFQAENLKTKDIFNILAMPFYREGINKLSLQKMLQTFTSNLDSLNADENQDLALDLIKYKVEDPNSFFEDYLRKFNQNHQSNQYLNPRQRTYTSKSFIQDGIAIFGQNMDTTSDRPVDFLHALRQINQQIFNQMKNTEPEKELTAPSENVIINSHRSNRSTSNKSHEINQQKHMATIGRNKTQSNFSADIGPLNPLMNGVEGVKLNFSPPHLQLQEQTSQEKKQLDLLKKETIRTINVLQNLVRSQFTKSKGSFHIDQSTLQKLGSFKSMSESFQEGFNRQTTKYGKVPSSRKPRDSLSSITIEESSEHSSNSKSYKKPPLSPQAKPSILINPGSSHSIRKKSHFFAKQELSSNNLNNTPQKISAIIRSSAKKKRTDLSNNSSDMIAEILNESEFNGRDGSQQIQQFQNQTEMELFGGASGKDIKVLDNNIYIRKMKRFDLELEKLRKTQEIKRERKALSQTQSQIKGPSVRNFPEIDQFQKNLQELNQRMKRIEQRQIRSKPQINFINSQINIDQSYVPNFFMKRIEKHGVHSSQQIQRNKVDPYLPNENSKIIEKCLTQTRKKIVGVSQSKDQKFNKLYNGLSESCFSSSSTPYPQQNLVVSNFQDYENIEQTARFKNSNSTVKNNTTQNTPYNASGEQIFFPKYNKRNQDLEEQMNENNLKKAVDLMK